MHPALSVVFFTAVSGSGYGLLFLLGLWLAIDPHGLATTTAWTLLLVGAGLATAGLLASLAHLGQPQRAWRALSQWRSSWLSREGVAAVASFVPIVVIGIMLIAGADAMLLRLAGLALALLAALTVYCTVRIYSSLIPIPAWRHQLVLPGYLGFALLGGALWLAALLALLGAQSSPITALGIALMAVLLGLLKWHYWRAIDDAVVPVTLAAATGIPGAIGMRPLEAPHTEANYLLREMGFVLARRHGIRLRQLTLRLLALAALSALFSLATSGLGAGGLLLLALLAGQLAILLERWLFFAQARHLVTLYYGATGAPERLSSNDFTAT